MPYEEKEPRSLQPQSESTVTIKFWAILITILGIYGFFFVTILNHERRVTVLETQFPHVIALLQDIKSVLSEHVKDQALREREASAAQPKRPPVVHYDATTVYPSERR